MFDFIMGGVVMLIGVLAGSAIGIAKKTDDK